MSNNKLEIKRKLKLKEVKGKAAIAKSVEKLITKQGIFKERKMPFGTDLLCFQTNENFSKAVRLRVNIKMTSKYM